jgi:hypothetical protein
LSFTRDQILDKESLDVVDSNVIGRDSSSEARKGMKIFAQWLRSGRIAKNLSQPIRSGLDGLHLHSLDRDLTLAIKFLYEE